MMARRHNLFSVVSLTITEGVREVEDFVNGAKCNRRVQFLHERFRVQARRLPVDRRVLARFQQAVALSVGRSVSDAGLAVSATSPCARRGIV